MIRSDDPIPVLSTPELIGRFWKWPVHELKENVKVVPKNSKETSENNTDVEMALHILQMRSTGMQKYSSDKRLIAAEHSKLSCAKAQQLDRS